MNKVRITIVGCGLCDGDQIEHDLTTLKRLMEVSEL